MKNKLLSVLLLALTGCTAYAGNTARLDSLYQQLDQAIAHTADYVKERQERIDNNKLLLSKSRTPHGKYKASFLLYEEYRSYKNDSAVYYLIQCINYAIKEKNPAEEGNAKALLAFQSSTTGKYTESFSILNQIDTTRLDAQGRRNYLMASQHLYGELSYYSNIEQLRKYYEKKAQQVSLELMKVLDQLCIWGSENRG